MQYSTTVKLVVAENPNEPIANVQVALCERDRLSRDDALGTAVTDAEGEASFQYSTEDFLDLDEKLSGLEPEVYAIVYDRDGRVVVSTRGRGVVNTRRKLLTVPITRELIARHRLLEP